MFTQLLGAIATVYGVLGAIKTLLQTRQMLARRSSGEVSAGFLASYAGGYVIWLTYGLSTGSLPLVVVDTVGLLCAGLTLAVALSLRGSSIRPASRTAERGARWTALVTSAGEASPRRLRCKRNFSCISSAPPVRSDLTQLQTR